MAKDPAFLFYAGDYLGGTMGFTLEQHGAYLLCLLLNFNTGRFTEEQAINVCGAQKKIWDKIKHKFQVDLHGLYYNKRIEEEKKKRISYCESRRRIGLHTRKHTQHHTDGRMEDEDEDEVVSLNSSGKGGVGEKDLTHPDDVPSEPPKEVESKQRAIKYMLEVLRLDLYQIEKLIEQYGVDYTLEKIELTQKNIRSIKNPIQYFVAAMKSNYVDTDKKAKTEAEAMAADRAKREKEWLVQVGNHLDAGKPIKQETFDRLSADLQAQLVYDQEHYKKTLEWRYIHSKFRQDLVKESKGE